MPKPILPDHLRERIIGLFKSGASSIEIHDEVYDESIPYVKSEEQLAKCISSIKGKVTISSRQGEAKPVKKINIPLRKKFDVNKHRNITELLSADMKGKEFENLCEPIVIDILKNYEGFKKIENANEASGFHNPPFDFFAFKGKTPYIIEFKGSMGNYNSPGETQKRRMKELLKSVAGLNIALLQVKVDTGEYRILYNDQLNLYFDGKPVSIRPVAAWIKSRLKH